MNFCSSARRPWAAFPAAYRLFLCRQNYRSFNHASKDRGYNGLRILFCGADKFSMDSLRAVQDLRVSKPDKIASIDVVCRPDKRVGRGLKQIQEVPIKGVARELDLPIHHLDTFTGWKPPSPFDLVIAVSFGLLVPARILNGTTYGGLNVHPSMLPDLRGAAPIQHAILDGRRYTGVTVQTMHPEEFDHGMILDQTPSPGIEIGEECTTEDLTSQLGPLGAAMLRETIDQGLFISPEAVTRESEVESPSLKHAPKITPEDGRIDWDTWPSDRILRAGRALGRLWDTSTVLRCNAAAEECRVTFEGKWKLVDAGKVGDMSSMRPGSPGPIFSQQTRQVEIAFRTIDGRFVSPGSVTVAGHGKGKGVAFLLRLLTYEVSKLP